MSTAYKQLEARILSLLSVGKQFVFNGINYEVIISGKPRGKGRTGEPKTDVYVQAKNKDSDQITEFKLSIKKRNADFLENKMQAERASIIWGQEWSSIIREDIIENIKTNILDKSLIYKQKQGRTKLGSICLGWRLDIMNKVSGELSQELDLTFQQKHEVLTGENLPINKKNASVNSQIIPNSGVANYIIENIDINDLNDSNIGQFL